MAKLILKTISTSSAAQTEAWASLIGANLRGGELIELISDLGGGKTTFVRGLVKGMGSQDLVTSPTFTIRKIYKANQLEVHHFDFYRLPEAGLIASELEDILDDKSVVIVMEWAGVVAPHLPPGRLTIRIEQAGGDRRLLEASYPKGLAYLMESGK